MAKEKGEVSENAFSMKNKLLDLLFYGFQTFSNSRLALRIQKNMRINKNKLGIYV